MRRSRLCQSASCGRSRAAGRTGCADRWLQRCRPSVSQVFCLSPHKDASLQVQSIHLAHSHSLQFNGYPPRMLAALIAATHIPIAFQGSARQKMLACKDFDSLTLDAEDHEVSFRDAALSQIRTCRVCSAADEGALTALLFAEAVLPNKPARPAHQLAFTATHVAQASNASTLLLSLGSCEIAVIIRRAAGNLLMPGITCIRALST